MLAAAAKGLGQEPAPLAGFEGEWVGLQTWTFENPSAQEPQPVTLTLAVDGGELTGSITPFLGGVQALPIAGARVVGDELRMSLDSSRSRNRWQRNVDVQFTFRLEANELHGTAELTMGAVPWLRFDYALSRKRSRY